MKNLYFNSSKTSKENILQFEYIKSSEISKNSNTCHIIIKDLWKELYYNKELVYKILKYAKKEDFINTNLNIFFMNNFYNDLFTDSNELPYELYYIIQKLFNDILSGIKKISEYSEAFEKSNLAYLLDGIILNGRIRNFFNLILTDIIEQYENSEESNQILLFRVEDIKNFLTEQEEKIKKEYLNSKNTEINMRKRQDTLLSKIYRMKYHNYTTVSNKNTHDDFNFNDNIDKDIKNNEVFASKYLPQLNRNDIIQLLNKETNEIMKNYLRYQLSSMGNDKFLYSNEKFLENIQNCSPSAIILYYYQKNFMSTINIIKKIIKKLNQNIKIIPEEIKMICVIMKESLKNKFNWIGQNEIIKYISEYFMRLLKSFFLSPDLNALISSVILSKNTKDNFKKIYDILMKLISGNFYKNTKVESDYTPFNFFFLEINQEFLKFFEQILNNENTISKIKNIETILNNKKRNDSHSIIYNIYQVDAIKNIIQKNHDKFYSNKKNDNSKIKIIIQKLIEKKEIINEFKNTVIEKKILFFSYNEVVYSPKILEIINRNKDKNFKIEEIKCDTPTEEVVNMNKLVRTKNLFFDLLNASPKLSKIAYLLGARGKDTKEILFQLNKFFKILSFYNENDNSNKVNTDSYDKNSEISRIPKDWYINSLMICLDNLDKEYSKNDYEKLYMSIKEDLIKSIKDYDFGELTKILKELKSVGLFKNKIINLQEKYKDIIINIKIRDIIENEPLEALIKFVYNDTQKLLHISKPDNYSNYSNDKTVIKCTTINDFIKNFPNLSLIQQKRDEDLFSIEKEIDLSNGLNQYFDLLKCLINDKFSKKENNIVFNKIQKYILIKIYENIYPRESDKDDMQIFTKSVLVSWVRPHHFKLDKTYLDNFVPITTNYINQLDIEKSPNGKFNIINKIFNAINTVLRFNKGCSFSIDDIAPICEYCLIKAQPERLSSNIKYLQNFISNDMSDLRKMRFDIMKNCMISIRDINYTKFDGINEKEFNELCNMAAKGVQ